MPITLVDVYECGECESLWEDARDAAECCSGGTWAWKCTVCGALYPLATEARTCHPDPAPEGDVEAHQ